MYPDLFWHTFSITKLLDKHNYKFEGSNTSFLFSVFSDTLSFCQPKKNNISEVKTTLNSMIFFSWAILFVWAFAWSRNKRICDWHTFSEFKNVNLLTNSFYSLHLSAFFAFYFLRYVLCPLDTVQRMRWECARSISKFHPMYDSIFKMRLYFTALNT